MIAERRLNGTDSEDLLGVLLSAKDEHCEGMSDQYVHDEVITMFVAGQETSAVALSWAVGCWRSILNCRSKLQQRLPRWRTAVTYRMRIIHA
jgi:cytochrome P450